VSATCAVAAAAPQVVGVGEPLDLGGQGGVLARRRRDALDLGDAEPEQLGLARPLRRLGAQLLERRAHVAPARPVGPEPLARAEHRRAGVAVERGALLRRLEQALLVALAVDRQDVLGELPEHTHRHAAAAEVGPRPPVGADAAAHQERSRRRARRPRPPRGTAPRSPPRAAGAPRRARAARPAAPARRRRARRTAAQALHHHRLARTGLAGHDGEAATPAAGRRRR
jgi:hypothetical protein